MKSRNLAEWAAIAEVIATLAVIISLVFVGYSIQQNTTALQGSTENLVFERHSEISMQFMLDPSLAEILVKMRSDDPQLSNVEAIRWEKYQSNLLDVWALAFNRYSAGLLAEPEWLAWDGYFTDLFSNQAEALNIELWMTWQYGFDTKFWAHVHDAVFGKTE